MLDIFDVTTKTSGAELHCFATTTCKALQTKELQQETQALQCHALKSNGSTSNSGQQSDPLPKTFNILTVKNHSLGDYPDQICHYGTTELFSTELVSTTPLGHV